MAYIAAHVLYTFSGTLPGGEEWSIGMRTGTYTPDLDELQAEATYFADCFAVLSNASRGLGTYNPLTWTFTTCTARLVGADGKTETVATGVPNGNVVGSASTPACPNQTACVVSLLTNRAGRSFRGRVYLPFLNPGSLTATGRLQAIARVDADNFVNTMVQLINGGATPVGVTAPTPLTHGRVSIQSQTSNQAAPPVTATKTGDVLDTQRRRRDKLIESYVQLAVPTPST